MAVAQPEPGGTTRAGGHGGRLHPERIAPLRGGLAVTASMETLQVGYLHAVAAAAGCSLAQPFPDSGIDWHVSHTAPGHAVDDEVTIKVQLKSTYQIPPHPAGPAFSFTLDNEHLVKLARTPVSVHKILVVMLVPRSPEEWLRAGHDALELRHCCYWTNLAGHPVTGRRRTTVRIPTSRIFDARALCEIMTQVGRGRETLMHRPFDESVRHQPPRKPQPGDPGDRLPGTAGLDPARIDPAVLGALLARHGWRRRGGAAGRYGRWTPPGPAAAGTSLLVPESRAFSDSTDLLAEALTALSRSADPAARDVLVGLAVPSDEIRWWRDVPDAEAAESGAAAWPAQERLRAGARAMLVAGALASRARAGFHGARYRREAEATLEQILIGPAPGTGRQLTVFVPVSTGRQAVTALLRALHAARDAADYQRATGGMEAFDAAVELGVCHELTEALVALVRGSEGVRIALEWSPAAGAPEGLAVRPEPVEFSPGDLPALREAGARYVRGEPSVPVRITGTVERMRRSAPSGPGTVRLRVLAGADVARVRMVLDEDAYRIAGQAHLVGLPVRVSGRLESRGGFRRVTGASDVVPVQVDEAERDRLVKSLQENLDFFEEACAGDEV